MPEANESGRAPGKGDAVTEVLDLATARTRGRDRREVQEFAAALVVVGVAVLRGTAGDQPTADFLRSALRDTARGGDDFTYDHNPHFVFRCPRPPEVPRG